MSLSPDKVVKQLKTVLKHPSYVFLTAVVTVLSYTFLASVLNYQLLWSALSNGNVSLFFSLVATFTTGFHGTMSLTAAVVTLLVAIGIGLNTGLIVYHWQEMAAVSVEEAGLVSGAGLAAIAPACAACLAVGTGALGLGTVLAVLPFGGTELNIVALLMLTGSAVWIARKIDQKQCAV